MIFIQWYYKNSFFKQNKLKLHILNNQLPIFFLLQPFLQYCLAFSQFWFLLLQIKVLQFSFLSECSMEWHRLLIMFQADIHSYYSQQVFKGKNQNQSQRLRLQSFYSIVFHLRTDIQEALVTQFPFSENLSIIILVQYKFIVIFMGLKVLIFALDLHQVTKKYFQ